MVLPLFNCSVDADAVELLGPVFASGQLGSGARVACLEADLSKRFDGKSVVAVSDITHALVLALQGAGVKGGMGHEVLTLSYNCMSSNSAIMLTGARPVWVDIDLHTACMDIESAASNITSSTKAILLYHVAGYPADTIAWRKLCDSRNLILIEDCNNALGAHDKNGIQVGSLGDFSIFSFYANRNVNGIEGGAVVCLNRETAQALKNLRRFGIDQSKFRDKSGEIDSNCDIPKLGFSASLSDVNATVARYHLADLDARLKISRANASLITSAISDIPGIKPIQYSGASEPAFWVMLLLCDERDRLMDHLKTSSVGCSKLHQPNHIYSAFDTPYTSLPQTDEFLKRILAVPCGWWMDKEKCRFLADRLSELA